MNGLLVGRFQPFHLGHLEALRFALSRVGMLWVGLGSSNRPPDADNPFSAAERARMITSSVGAPERDRISLYAIPDAGSHERWAAAIDSTVPGFGAVFSNDAPTARAYSARPVRVVPIPLVRRGSLSGTNVRELVRSGGAWEGLVPAGTRDFLSRAGARGRLGDLYK